MIQAIPNKIKTGIRKLSVNSYPLFNLYEAPRVLETFKLVRNFKSSNEKTRSTIYKMAQQIGIGQREGEIKWVADLLLKHKPRNLIEIGTQKGGNAFFLSHFMPEKSSLITIDIAPRILFEMQNHNYQRMKAYKEKVGAFVRKNQVPFSSGYSYLRRLLIKSFSSEKCKVIPFYTYFAFEEDAGYIFSNILDCQKFDCLFYDADKAEHNVNRILSAYLPHLKKGGLLILQDINYAPDSDHNGMRLYWEKLDRNNFEILGKHIVGTPNTSGGIGVAIKK